MYSKKQLDSVLQKHFGYKELKQEQYDIINNVLAGRDVCAILPTGFGKSICYQIPFLVSKKIVVVVSPLIALMEDQVKQLQEKNIMACSFNSTNSNKNLDMSEIYKGKHKIIYTSPEYLSTNEYIISKLYEKNILALVAIDEAHCVSSWGNDFRPSYQKLKFIKEFAPDIPILALTATATKKIQDDICNFLLLKDHVFITGNFDRPNLHINIGQRDSDIFENTIGPLLHQHKQNKMLIYCKTKDDTEKLASKINAIGITCDYYHAGKSAKLRQECQEKFSTGKLNCIVATIAFGLGINIPNIRLVVHYNCPGDLESYYQEIGRAGRDGQKSYCYMFFSNKDFMISNFFIKEIKDDKFKQYKEHELKYMQQFVYSKLCRRNMLLKHFDKTSNVTSCDMCDICCCKIKNSNLEDQTIYAILFLGLLEKYNKKMGKCSLINILRGSKSQKIIRYQTFAQQWFGRGKDQTEEWWKHFINQLLVLDYVNETNLSGIEKCKFGSVIELTNKSKLWLKEMKEIENLQDIPDNLKIIVDIPIKMKKILISNDICKQNFTNASCDVYDKFNMIIEQSDIIEYIKPDNRKTQEITYDLFLQEKTIKEIAQIRNLSVITIENHILDLFKEHKITDYEQFALTNKIYRKIIKKIKKYKIDYKNVNLSSINDILKKKYSYFHIKLSLFILDDRYMNIIQQSNCININNFNLINKVHDYNNDNADNDKFNFIKSLKL